MSTLDMALDEIIKDNKTPRRGRGRGSGGPGRGQGRRGDGKRTGGPQRTQGLKGKPGKEDGSKIQITNLGPGVTNGDLKELFGQIGPVTSAHVKRDSSGESTGVGFVTFARRNDGQRAVQKYHQVTLDARPMIITLQGGPKPTPAHGKPSSRGGRGGRGGGRGGRPKPTAEQLDKEMEAYLAAGNAPAAEP